MSKFVPDKLAVSNPDDNAFQTGKPASSGLFLRLNQAVSHMLELINGGGSTLDGSKEWLMPHDHSGSVTSGGKTYNHGAFVGRVVASGLGTRLLVLPFTDAAWDYKNGIMFNQIKYGGVATDCVNMAPFRAAEADKSYNINIIYMGHYPVRLRRGTNRIIVRADAYQLDATGGLDAGYIYAAAFSSAWEKLNTTDYYDVLTQTTAIDVLPTSDGHTDVTRSIVIDLASQLTADTDAYIVIGLYHPSALVDGVQFLFFGATSYEAQV